MYDQEHSKQPGHSTSCHCFHERLGCGLWCFFMCCAMAVSLYFCVAGSSMEMPSLGHIVQPATGHIRMLFLRVFWRL